ncbi:MAG TPA: CPBP family intramembrane metalloprotease [Chloroflexaceae bacterium]|nr:CPBP family intramembrane metalloprotease [Chloroflexaceae bacterium]
MLTAMSNTALISGAIAAGYWFLRAQTIHKGFGLTVHWWSLVDLLAGLLISTLAMFGIFLVEWLIGGIRVEAVQLNLAVLGDQWRLEAALALFEEFVSRACQLPGLQITLALLLALVLRGRLGGSWESRTDKTLGWCAWPAILIIAAVFGYVHISNPNATPVSAFGNALGGLMYGIAFIGGRNLWMPVGMHFGWNFVQGPVLGFPVSGTLKPSLITLQETGSDLLTGGAFGPEAGLIGMFFRFVIIAMVLGYLYLRAGRRGNVARLEFPIAVYDNPPGSRRPLFGRRNTVAPRTV